MTRKGHKIIAMNQLYYGDNLEILRKKIKDSTVDLCYIDPPFNSKRNYNQIYNNVGEEDRAQAQAFTDTWKWDDLANAGLAEIVANAEGRFQPQLVDLIKGLHPVLKQGSLFAYLISIALRVTEIQRVLKSTGSFYLHCDPTSSHYLKLVLDAVFCAQSGEFQNEIVWSYQTGGASKQRYARKHDVILFYTKSAKFTFNSNEIREPRTEKSLKRAQNPNGARISADDVDKLPTDVFQIPALNPMSVERLGYPTQKPEALLERIIKASSNENDVVLDAYCGCGTSVAVAQKLKRQWLGIDITYQSISLVLRRLEKAFGGKVMDKITLDGIPKDLASAGALAHKTDDRLRKEFEKWAVLCYTSNRGIINEKKGADAGIDAVAYFLTNKTDSAKIVFQVKSGGVNRGDVAKLRGDMGRENAVLGVLITLEKPSRVMLAEAKKAGQYRHDMMGQSYNKISIVTIQEIVEQHKRLEIPMSLEVVAAAKRAVEDKQIELNLE
jgi:site-specific DNA-methyltransferase (adenine-specific)